MHFLSKAGLLLLFITLVGGCTSNPYTADNNIGIYDSSNYGLVVLSVNTEGSPKGFQYILKSEDSGIQFSIPDRGALDSMLPMLISDFRDIKGKLVVLKLPKGKYKFVEWIYSGTGINQYPADASWSKLGFPIYFNVENGKVNYIGQVSRINTYSGNTLLSSKIIVTDKEQRDISLFLQKYPNIKLKSVYKNLAHK